MIPAKDLFIRSFQQARDQGIEPAIKKGVRIKSERVKRIAGNHHIMQVMTGVTEENDAHEGRPAIVAAAGPSLTRHYDQLRDTDICLVAVDTALPALCKQGLFPDYTGVTEENPEHVKLWEGWEEQLKHTILIVPNYIDEEIYMMWPGPTRMYHTWGTGEENALQENLGPDLGLINNIKSITTAMVYFAIAILGCDPIILVGHDYGFRPGESYYAEPNNLHVPGKILGSVFAENSLGLPLLAVDGMPTQTNRSLWNNKIEMDRIGKDLLSLDPSRRLWNLDASSLLDPAVWQQRSWPDVAEMVW